MALDFRYPNADASSRGWGAGWPNCQTQRMVPLVGAGVGFGSIRTEIHDLLELLIAATAAKGYPPKAGQCFGFACRATKRADGTFTSIPSNHSWGLAVDYNTLENVYGAPEASSVIATKQKWMPALWHDYGFRWLGPPISDWEHFDFAGTPTDAAMMTVRAQHDLGGGDMSDFVDGIRDAAAGKALPNNASGEYGAGWHSFQRDKKNADDLAALKASGAVGHSHDTVEVSGPPK